VTNGFPKDMVLAVAWPHTDIADPTRWFYAYKDDPSVNCNGATPCRPCADTGNPSPCYVQVPPTQAHLVAQLKRVADNIWGDVSVDVICHDQAGTGGRPSQNACMFVMVHGGAFMSNGQVPPTTNPDCARAADVFQNRRYIFVRTTTDDLWWPPANHGSYFKSQKPTQEDLRQSTYVSAEISDRTDWDRSYLCGTQNGTRYVTQIQAHDELSPPGQLLLSWVINGGTNAPVELWANGVAQTETNRQSNVRFGALPLSKFRPWCQATNTCPPTIP
jgi:hypothetical protein